MWLTLSVCLQSYLFLLSSDYERSEWRESIQKLQRKGTSSSIPLAQLLSVVLSYCRKKKSRFVPLCLPDLQTCVLSSVELQVLTSSCFKLRTVHNIPVTSNKDGKKGEMENPLLHINPYFHPFMFTYFLCFSSTHFFFLCLTFELNLQQKSTF